MWMRRRDRVVARLSLVDMVVGVNRLLGTDFAAQRFDGEVGDDLVDVHIGGGAGPGLEDVDGKVLFADLALGDFKGGVGDGLAILGSRRPSFSLALAAAHLMRAKACTTSKGMIRSLMLKLSTARCVWAP